MRVQLGRVQHLASIGFKIVGLNWSQNRSPEGSQEGPGRVPEGSRRGPSAKLVPRALLGPFLEPFRGPLESLLGPSWTNLGLQEILLGPSWGRFGSS